jgi:predicted nucleotidyltransferase
MDKATILKRLKEHKEKLDKEFGIEELALFGSQARDEAKGESDIDLLILKSRFRDYFLRTKAKYYLEELLGAPVDLGYFDAIRPVLRRRISKEMIRV